MSQTILFVSALGAITKPHIIFSVIDDHGWSDAGFTGRSRAHTPTIDAYANSGIRLLQMYVQKVCSPTRTAIMTGRYPHRMGMQTPFCGGMAEGLNLNETLLPQRLNSVGYISHAVGKWHLGFTTWKHTPTFRGFSSFYGYYGCAEDYFTHSDPLRNATFGIDFHEDNGIDCGGPPFPRCSRPALEAVAHGLACYAGEGTPGHVPQLCWATGKAPPAVPSDAKRCCYGCDDTDHYSTTLIARRATAIITNHNTSMPLFLYLPFQETHGPAEVPLYWRAMVDEELVPNPVRRELFGKLRALDSAFKNITQALKSHPDGDMLANTIWIYTTDNGGPIVPSTGANDDAIGASNWPLRGGKHNAYEGGVRGVAWIWDGRGILHPTSSRGFTYNGLMHAVDWTPTLCAIAGCSVPHPLPGEKRRRYDLSIDGIDQSEAIRANSTSPRIDVVLDIEKPRGDAHAAMGVVRIGPWKLHLGNGSPSRPGDWSSHIPWANNGSGVTVSEKTTHYGEASQLYNVVDDPEERYDLINVTAHAAVIDRLRALYDGERAIAVYPFPLGQSGHPQQNGVWEPWLDHNSLQPVTP